MAEKLMNTREVSQYLGISEEDLRKLVDRGEFPAYRLGGTILRFRKDQIEQIKGRGIPKITNSEAETIAASASYTKLARLRDFLYFNDFYIFSVIIIIILLIIIFFY